ncbi:transcriptional regulator [Lyngbya sp. PCC 8106]|uniref:transcriptional regulator n=1 Tax=Lyngbya sp. (strain PCC 8106) TaxID=313612 RepID=UPI0000EA98E3|nr:transcriptional regulator [Lyngbya sp. PCC 8106]EAW35144.1 hypothetical protein L8106_13555 [Lyngbya sp. PCC 8106]
MECKITFGRVLSSARKNSGYLQRELCELLKSNYSIDIDHYLLSKLENNHVDIKLPEYDALVKAVAEIFSLDIGWLETIRQQTEVEQLDLSGGIFPIYVKEHKEH